MRYQEFEAAVRRLVAGARDEAVRAFGAETVARVVRDDELTGIAAAGELDDDAAAAFTVARANAATAGAAELRALLTRIDDGVLSDGDMDPELLIAVSALEHWTTYLETGHRDEIHELAVRAVEQVDHRAPADLDDFLAGPEMAAEYARIERLLAA